MLILINVELAKKLKKEYFEEKNDLKDFDDLLDVKYGKRGNPIREKWEN